VRQFYRQSSTTPPEIAARDQLRLASTRSTTENLRSPLDRVTPIFTRRVLVLQEDEIYDESDCDDDENNGDREDNLSNGLCNNLGEPEPTTQSNIAAIRKMMEKYLEDPCTPKRVNSRLIETSSNTDSYIEHPLSKFLRSPYP
jgi:hypothetical protein